MRSFRIFWLVVVLFWLAAYNGWAATKRWEPKALAVPQITTFAVTGTWTTGNTGTVTCNTKNLTVTVGATTTNEFIAQAITAAINSDDTSEQAAHQDNVGDETKNIGGQQIPEFKDFYATVSGTTVTVTSRVDGVPFTISISDTAGSGALDSLTTTQEATGPWHFDNANNWDTESLPVDMDVIRFDQGAGPCRYGLDYLFRGHPASDAKRCNFEVTTDYEGYIGLELINPAGYKEYRQVDLDAGGTTNDPNGTPSVVYRSISFIPGVLGKGGCIARLNLTGKLVNGINISNAGRATPTPRVFIRGSSFYGLTKCTVQRGAVMFDSKDNPPTTTSSYSSIVVGVRGLSDNLTRVWFDSDTDLAADGKTIDIYSGETFWRGRLVDGGGDNYIINVYGGRFVYEPYSFNALYQTTVHGGVFRWNSPGDTTLQENVVVNGPGTFDMSGVSDPDGVTLTGDVTATSGARVILGGNVVPITPGYTGPDPIIIEP